MRTIAPLMSDASGTWNERFSERAGRFIPSGIRALATMPQAEDTIPLGPGEPDPALFPVAAIRQTLVEVIDETGSVALQYAASAGDPGLRQLIRDHMVARGVVCEPTNVLLTNGAQQALHLLAEALVDPGDTVLTQVPTYPGALQILSAQGATIAPLETGSPSRRVSLVYATANFQNPTGRSLTLAEREHVVAVARAHDAILVEDDPYEILRFTSPPQPSLQAVATSDASIEEARTVYLGTFSKSVAPGFRIGWLVGPRALVEKVTCIKETQDLQVGSLAQLVLARLLAGGIDRFAGDLRAAYRARRDALATAVASGLGDRARWELPGGGFFLWLTSTGGLDASQVLREAAALGVTFVPGAAFTLDGSARESLRLSYSIAPPERFPEAIARLAAAIDRVASR